MSHVACHMSHVTSCMCPATATETRLDPLRQLLPIVTYRPERAKGSESGESAKSKEGGEGGEYSEGGVGPRRLAPDARAQSDSSSVIQSKPMMGEGLEDLEEL